MNELALILADEPSGSLDTRSAESLHQEIIRLSRVHHQAFVIATHNPKLSQLCDRVLCGVLHLRLKLHQCGQHALLSASALAHSAPRYPHFIWDSPLFLGSASIQLRPSVW